MPRRLVATVVLVAAALAVPAVSAGASTRRAKLSGEVLIGHLSPINSTSSSTPEIPAGLKAAVKGFDKRGGAGGKKIVLDICDTRGDPNQEVACARKLVSDGVVATMADLNIQNAAAVNQVFANAGIPRIGIFAVDISDFSSKDAFPLLAGPLAGYVADAVQMKKIGKTKLALIHPDVANANALKSFIEPSMKKIGVDIVADIAVPAGTTDYSQFVVKAKDAGADSILLSEAEAEASQTLAALQQLNSKLQSAAAAGSVTLEALRKFPKASKGMILTDSLPYPVGNVEKQFPGLKTFFADMKNSHDPLLKPDKLKPSIINSWASVLAFTKLLAGTTGTITKETVLNALKTKTNIDIDGLMPAWTPSKPGFSVFASSSNHFSFPMTFNGKTIVTTKPAIDITQYFS